MNMINMLQTFDCSNIRKEDACIKRDIENKLTLLYVWHQFKFNNFGTQGFKWAQVFSSFILLHYLAYI